MKCWKVFLFCLLPIFGAAQPSLSNAVTAPTGLSRLAEAIRFPTISVIGQEQPRGQDFLNFHKFLENAYPQVGEHLLRKTINQYSLLFEWPGSDSALAPIMLYAHMDVVPVETGLDTSWTHPPFEGVIEDGYLWGRGSLDDKYRVIALLETVEGLLAKGHQPQRTVFLAFGHDEEVGGQYGAHGIAQELLSRGLKMASVMDEGLSVLEDVLPGVSDPFALVGMAEKGSLDLELSVNGDGGHSAVPPKETSIGILSKAIATLQENPFPARLLPVVEENLRVLAPFLPAKYRLGLNNLWLFRGQVLKALAEDQVTDAVIRTKLSPTVIHGGVKANVLPKEAHATVNIRLLPGDSIEQVLETVRQTINDERVSIKIIGNPMEASPVTAYDGPEFAKLKQVIGQVFPDVPVAPTLMPSGTDSKHFSTLSDNLFRFSPIRMNRTEGARIHNLDERISVDALAKVIEFYSLWITTNS